MKRTLPKHFAPATIAYLLIGILIGMYLVQDTALDDVGIGKLCESYASCLRQNAYLIPATTIAWPLLVVGIPTMYLGSIFSLAGVVGLMLMFVIQKRSTADNRSAEK